MNGPLKCGSCTACCRSNSGVVLMPPDDIGSYDYILAPATAELIATLQQGNNSDALFPIEELKDAPEDFMKLAQERGGGFAVAELKRHENGDCVYLGKAGCTIYERRPAVCRGFDCRNLFLSHTRNERRDWIRSGMMSREVYAAARERLDDGVAA